MLTVTEAAALASVHRKRIAYLLRTGRIAGEKRTLRMWLVDESSLRAWMSDPVQHKAGNPNFKRKGEIDMTQTTDQTKAARRARFYAKLEQVKALIKTPDTDRIHGITLREWMIVDIEWDSMAAGDIAMLWDKG